MVARNDTSKRGSHGDPAESSADSARPSRRRSALEQAIDAERAQLLQAHAVLTSLYEVLLHADHENAVSYAEAAHLAAKLIDDSVARLTNARLQPMIEALSHRGLPLSSAPAAKEPESALEAPEPRPVYM